MKKLISDIERYYQLSGDLKPVSGVRLLFAALKPRLAPNIIFRLSEFCYRHQLGLLSKLFTVLNIVIFGIEISPRVAIGGGLFLPHTVGTVLGAESIGENVTIMQGVTLGSKEPEMGFTASARPIIDNHVVIGAGAKVIGRVTVGEYAKIGANAVVLHDVPPHALAVGVPAKIMRQKRPVNAQG